MKKSLIALAVLGAVAGTASAQSSVTMYGIVDIGVQWNEVGVNLGTSGTPRWEQESTFGIESGFQSGSRLGVRGSEALGGAWSAIFTLEAGFDVSTGTSGQGGRLFGRQAWGGFQHTGMGSFVAGRVATVSSGTGSFDLWGAVDPFGTGFGFFGLQGTFIPSNALREDNAVLWRSPNWGGFNFGASYSFNISGPEVVPSGNNIDGFGLGGNWTWGPLLIAVTYDQINAPDTITGPFNQDQKMLQFGAVVDLKFLKIHGAYANQSDISLVQSALSGAGVAPTGLIPYDNKAFMLGVTVPLFGGALLASYQVSDADEVTFGLSRYEPDYTIFGVGYTYPLSRRTNMYIGYGQGEWDGTITSTPVVVSPSERFDRAQFALGIRHMF